MWRGAIGLLALLGLLTGCVGPHRTGPPSYAMQPVEAPLVRPVWATEHDSLLAFTVDGRRLLSIDPETGDTRHSMGAADAGENVALIPQPTELLVLPRPGSDRVSWVDTKSFEEVRGVEAGDAPSWVAVHPTSKSLFVLSADGSAVTGVDIEEFTESFRLDVPAGAEAVIEPGEDSPDPAFWITGPGGGAARYAGRPPQRTGTEPEPATGETFGPDQDTPGGRAYLAEDGSPRVQAVEADASGALGVVASADLGETVEHLESRAKDELRVYVATASRLVVLRSDTLEVLDTVDLRDALDGAEISGMAVGDHDVYLTLEGEPSLLRIRKPQE